MKDAAWIDCNLNDMAEVTLTERGKQMMLEYFETIPESSLMNTAAKSASMCYPGWDTGPCKMPLHRVALIFGAGMDPVFNPPIKMNIRIRTERA